MLVKFSNNVATALTNSITDSATSFDLDDVSALPTIISGEHFYLSILSGGNGEIVKVTGVAGNTITCVRGVDGTSGTAGLAADVVELRITTAMLTDAFDAISDLAPALHFLFETTTTDADQGAGLVSGNNATFASSTILYITDEDDNGVDVSGQTSTWGDFAGVGTAVRGTIVIRSKENPTTRYVAFHINGALTDGTGYWKFPVANVYTAGVLVDAEPVTIEFIQAPAQSASATLAGIVELLTSAEAITGTDTTRAMTAAAFRAALVDGNDTILGKFNLKDFGMITVAKGNLGATPAFDLSAGNCQTGTVDEAITSSTFTNPTGSDELCSFILFLTNGGAFSVAWPTSVDWAGASAPSLVASGVDILAFHTYDGGTIWHGILLSGDSS